LPWYCPNPLCPTPPNGSESIPYCKMQRIQLLVPTQMAKRLLGMIYRHAYLYDGVVEGDAPRRRLLDDPAFQ
jgi:hypothetical protein